MRAPSWRPLWETILQQHVLLGLCVCPTALAVGGNLHYTAPCTLPCALSTTAQDWTEGCTAGCAVAVE